MINVSDDLMNVLRYGSYRYKSRAYVTRGGQLLAADIPITSGGEWFDDTLSVPERVEITVPRVVDGVDYEPTGPLDALAPFGQRLHVQLGVDLGVLGVEWFERGEFLIQSADARGDAIDVTAVGLLAQVDEARLIHPYTPAGTLATCLRNMVEPAVTVLIDSGLTDRAVPSTLNFDGGRIDIMWEILDAWPARALTMPSGYLYVYPETQTFAHDWNLFQNNRDDSPFDVATVLRPLSSWTRDGVYNAVVAVGTGSDGGQIQATVVDQSGSASAYGGPFSHLPVPYFFESPFLTTPAQCRAAAQQQLYRLSRQSYGRWAVECVPVPILTGRDGVWVYDDTPDIDQAYASTQVEKLYLPYTADGGPMTLTIRKASA